MRVLHGVMAAALVLPGGLVGCAAYSSPEQQAANACQILGPKTLVGGVAGAAGGAAIGAAAGGGRGAAIGAGLGLLVGLVGGHVADQQDCAAAKYALQARLFQARPYALIAWNSPSGHRGEYQALGDSYASPGGGQCRRAQSVAAPGSGQASTPLVVCRQPNGDYTYSNA